MYNWGNRFVAIGEGIYDRAERWQERSLASLIELLPEALANLSRYLTNNNNCSYKLVLALVFIRGMDDRGTYHLPVLKDRFYNFYLGRHRKGEMVEDENILMQRIAELDAAEVKNKAIRRPLESLLVSGFWKQELSSLYLQKSLVVLLADPAVHDLLLITLLKGIDDYFTSITPPPLYPPKEITVEMQTSKPDQSLYDGSEEGIMNTTGESTISIYIKKKNRGRITL